MSTALQLAKACRDAYASLTNVGNSLCNAHITRAPNAVITAFQGSNDRDDWHSNFDFTLISHGPGLVSRGFLSSYLAVQNTLLAQSMPDEDEIALITGHSRGAPQACLHALNLVEMGFPVALVTFASPRWCNQVFATYFNRTMRSNHQRIVFESDLVTRLPFCFGHVHTSNLQWFDGSRWRNNMPLHTRLGVYLFNRKWPFIFNNVADHGIEEYITALQEHPL